MSAVDLSRLQFATTTIYHFLFVPLTIGLAFLTAILQTLWYRKGHPEHLRLTRFFGTLLVINVAVGVVTGLVQEFQFGMNWSSYSRFVGDVFGTPLYLGLAAFFLESVFLGVWLFGWDRLSKRVHLATIWAVAVGGVLSAAVHHGGQLLDAAAGRLPAQRGRRPGPAHRHLGAPDQHRVPLGLPARLAASMVTASAVMLAVSAWHLKRDSNFRDVPAVGQARHRGADPGHDAGPVFGGRLGINETRYQPMKIAAPPKERWTPASRARSRCSRSAAATRSDPDQDHPGPAPAVGAGHRHLERPGGRPQRGPGPVLQQYDPGNYIPNIFIQYWSMRAMAYRGHHLVLLVALCGAFLLWRKKLPTAR